MTDHGLEFDLLSQRIHPAASRVSEARGRDARGLRRVRPAGRGRSGPAGATLRGSTRRARAGGHRERVVARRAPDTRRRASGPLVRRVRGRRARRARREGRHRHLSTRRPRLAEGQAPANGELRDRWLPVAQGRQGDRLAAPRPLRRHRNAPPRRRRIELRREAPRRGSSRSSRRTERAPWTGIPGPAGRPRTRPRPSASPVP